MQHNTNASGSLVARLLPSLLLAAAVHGWTGVARGAETRAFVYATDFSTGSLANIQFGPPRTVTPNVATVSSDAVLRSFNGLLYVVNRFGFDNIQVLDPGNNFATVRQFSVGNGSNPHDIEFVSATKAYVTRYESSELWIVNPQTGQHTGTVSLADFADADGIPEMDRLALRNGRLFVSVQRLDRNSFFSPTDSSQVVVIDAATNALVDADPGHAGVQGIILPFQNPGTEIVVDPAGKLLVGCSGNFGVADGGIVRLNPFGLTIEATEATEAGLGGDLNDVAVFSSQKGFVVISDPSFNTLLRSYNRGTGQVTGTPFSTAGFNIADTEINDRGELWLCDRTPSNPGVRVFDAVSGGQLTAAPLNTGLPPQDLTFDTATTVDVAWTGADGAVRPLSLLAAYPNPSSGRCYARIRFTAGTMQEAQPLSIAVYDLTGRRVYGERLGVVGPGDYTVSWDGRTDSGGRASGGLYLYRITVGPHHISSLVVRQ